MRTLLLYLFVGAVCAFIPDEEVQAFNSSRLGKRVNGADFQISSNANSALPTVVPLNNGGFMVFWQAPGNGLDLFGRVFTASGAPAGSTFTVTDDTGDQSDATAVLMTTGNVFVGWAHKNTNANPAVYLILGRSYSPNGNPIDGQAFIINSGTTGQRDKPAFTAVDNGGVFAAWQEYDPARQVIAGFFNGDAQNKAFSNQAPIHTYPSTAAIWNYAPRVCTTYYNEPLVMWRRQDANNAVGWPIVRARVMKRRYFDDGTGPNDGFQVSSDNIASQSQWNQVPNGCVKIPSTGNNLLVYTINAQCSNCDRGEIMGREYVYSGTPAVTDDFKINTITSGTQNNANPMLLSTGNLVTVFDGANNVWGRIFNANGSPISSTEFAIPDTSKSGNKVSSSTTAGAVLSNGNVVACWVYNSNIWGQVMGNNVNSQFGGN